MGTWGDGIYDNDAALDALGDLVKFPPPSSDPAELAVGIGLVAWLNPSKLVAHGEELLAHAEANAGGLPPAARDALAVLVRHPRAATASGSRSAAARAALGDYADGPRLDALIRLPGGRGQIDALADRAARALDRLRGSLYEIAGDLAALGVVVELTQAQLWRPAPARAAAWRAKFDQSDQSTREERGFWDEHVARVRLGFDLLA